MTVIKSSALLLAGLVSVGFCALPALAASPATETFLANVTPNIDFLDRSSRMALENSKSVKVKDFAHGQAVEQTLAANAIYDATQALPVETGRSVASSNQPAPAADTRLPMGQEDLDSIEGLNGVEFDEAFRAKQRTALLQVQSDYEDYIAKGDDASLKAIAARELPKVKKRIAALSGV